MPYIKSRDIRTTPLRSLRYICNPAKTEGGILVASVNCMAEPNNAYEEMKRVYEFYSGRKFIEPLPKDRKGKIKLIHYIQSFAPQENISPEVAGKIAVDMVHKMFGDKVQALVATHTDRQHCHNHVIINVYDLDGKRYYSNQKTLNKLKAVSDSVCLQYGIKPYDKTGQLPKPKISAYNEWEALKKGISWKQVIRDKIDELIPTVSNLEELLERLEQSGCTVKRGKYISVKASDQQRAVRTKILGTDYTEESLVRRIAESKKNKSVSESECFYDSYYNICCDFVRSCGAYRHTSTAKQTHDFYYGQYVTLVRERLESIDMVRKKLVEAEKKYYTAKRSLDEVKGKCDELDAIIRNAEYYLNDMKYMQRTFPRTERDKTAVDTVKKYDIRSADDVEQLKVKFEGYQNQYILLSEKLQLVQSEVIKYRDIADTFDMLSSGEDYISRLVREAKDKCSADEWWSMVSEQIKAIHAQLTERNIRVSSHTQRKIADKLMKLTDMNVESEEVSRLVRVLAVMSVENISSEKESSVLIGKMKASQKSVYSESRDYQRRCNELNEAINRVDIYIRFKDSPDYPDKDWLAYCRSIAEKYDAVDTCGLERLKAQCDELKKKFEESEKRGCYYERRANNYECIIRELNNIERYPDELRQEKAMQRKNKSI